MAEIVQLYVYDTQVFFVVYGSVQLATVYL